MPEGPKTRWRLPSAPLLLLLPLLFVLSAPGQNPPAPNPQTAPAPNAAPNAANLRIARLSRAEGDVGIVPAGSAARAQAVANMPVQQGDTLSTGAGMAEVEFDDGSTVFLNQNSQLEFTQLTQSAAGPQTELTLKQGSIAVTSPTAANTPAAGALTVTTPTFQITAPQNAEFRVNTLGADGASVEVTQGSITVSTKAGSVTLARGQSVALHQNELNQPQIVGMAGPDNFDAWVASMVGVQTLGRNGEMRFWSPPVYYGYSDLATFGTWMDFENFGAVWRPYASAPNSDWHPYQNGGWTFRPDVGWVWVSYEPWGWLPYHYGTWHFAPDGWFWVPGAAAGFRQWQGARVQWIGVPGGQVGWVAISPLDATAAGNPVNLVRGVVLSPPAATAAGTPNVLDPLTPKQLRGATVLASPPRTLTPRPLPPPTRFQPPEIAEFARGMSSIVYDPVTRTYSAGAGLYVPNSSSAATVAVDPRLVPNARVRPMPSLATPNALLPRQDPVPVPAVPHAPSRAAPAVPARSEAAPATRGTSAPPSHSVPRGPAPQR